MIDAIDEADRVSVAIEQDGRSGLLLLQLLDLLCKLPDLSFQFVDRSCFGIPGGMTTSEAPKQHECCRHGDKSFLAPVKIDSRQLDLFWLQLLGG